MAADQAPDLLYQRKRGAGQTLDFKRIAAQAFQPLAFGQNYRTVYRRESDFLENYPLQQIAFEIEAFRKRLQNLPKAAASRLSTFTY